MKEEEKALCKFNCDARPVETNGLMSRDWTIVRLNHLRKQVLLVINRTLTCELLFTLKYKGKLIRCDNKTIVGLPKILDACWIGEFIVILTGDFKILTVNLRHETVFWNEENGRICNFMYSYTGNSKKIEENSCFLMKNEKEDCLVAYIDKNVAIYSLVRGMDVPFGKGDETVVKGYQDLRVNCLFNEEFNRKIRGFLGKSIEKIKKTEDFKDTIQTIFAA